ncbi:MAG: MFS transporter [Myxococcota bacterium]
MKSSAQLSADRSSWLAIILLAAVNLINYMDRTVLYVLLPAIKRDLALSDTELGVLTGLAFALFYAAFGIPIALWADRSIRRNIVAVVLALWSVMTALTGLATTFTQLALARIGVGVCESGCIPSSHSMISDIVPVERRASALGVFSAGGAAGAILGLSIGGVLSASWGWRWTLVAFGAPGLVVALILRLTLAEPPRRTKAEVAPSTADALRALISRATYIHVVLIFAGISLVSAALVQWTPSFYTRSFSLTSDQVGPLFALAYGVGTTVGTLAGGFMVDAIGPKSGRRIMRFAAICYAMALAFGVLAYQTSSLTVSVASLSGFMILASAPNGGLFAILHGAVPEHMRAAAVAVAMFVASAVGMGLGPVVVGSVSDALSASFESESLRYALMLTLAVLAWPIAQLFFAARSADEALELR